VNVGPVTLGFKRSKDAHSIVDQHWLRSLGGVTAAWTLRGSVLSFVGRTLLCFVSPIR